MKKPKCSVCYKPISLDCDYNQGRCPHRPQTISTQISLIRQVIYVTIAPIVILCWAITHPHAIWRQAKKDWFKK